MFALSFLTIGLAAILGGCTGNRECSVSVGSSSINFVESDDPNSWKIDSLVCPVGASPKKLVADDYIPGSCSQLKDSDYENFYKVQLGLLCYSGGQYDAQLAQKGKLLMISPYERFAR